MTLEELKKLAETAVRGQRYEWGEGIRVTDAGGVPASVCRVDRPLMGACDFIVALSPATVLKLLEMIACYEKAFATADASQIARAREIERIL